MPTSRQTACMSVMAIALGLSMSMYRPAHAAEAGGPSTETPQQRDARMQWFREARFGMFIHWGVYAVPAGEWQGKTDYAEWFLEQTKMPVSQYERYAQQFNPVKFDAKAWVRMAKDAGMKYIVITSKHHDGFGMFRSDLTDWCIKSTPFQRDPLKELADACAEAGIKMCFYHSIMDWHHPDYAQRRAWNDKVPTTPPDMDRYVTYMKGQLKELLTRYGPLGILWFDGEWEAPWTHERGVDLYNYVRSLQPQIIINNRVGKGRSGMQGMDKGQGVGDYGTPEQEIPPTGFGSGVDWESCMTMNGHWGYNKNDNNWKSAQMLIRNLVDCSSKGGNYLLNIGPTAEGEFPQASIERLAVIGKWMKANNESIYGTTASPFTKLPWGRCTKKVTDAGATLYLHVFDWPKDGKLVVPGLRNAVAGAKLLTDGKKLEAVPTADGVTIDVPAQAPDPIDTVVVLEVKGNPLNVEPVLTSQASDGSVTLPAEMAEIHNSEDGTAPHIETFDGVPSIGFWTNAKAWIDWQFKIAKPARFDVVATLAATGVGKCEVAIGDQKLTADIPSTDSYQKFQMVTWGQLEVKQPGPCTLSIKPVSGQWRAMNLRSVVLKPAQ